MNNLINSISGEAAIKEPIREKKLKPGRKADSKAKEILPELYSNLNQTRKIGNLICHESAHQREASQSLPKTTGEEQESKSPPPRTPQFSPKNALEDLLKEVSTQKQESVSKNNHPSPQPTKTEFLLPGLSESSHDKMIALASQISKEASILKALLELGL